MARQIANGANDTMSTTWESLFTTWAQPPSDAEQQRSENAIRAVRKALDADKKVSSITKVYVQGSYRNRVNVREDSDVDLGVLYTGGSFFADYPEGMTREDFGNTASDYSYSEFKNDVGRALTRHFGTAVKRGDKAFDIHENTNRIDADVVPVLIHRRYRSDHNFICGVQFNPDSGGIIINWPERLFDNRYWPHQHYDNGVAKNAATDRFYKGAVRIVKRLRNAMDRDGIAAAGPVYGFFIECLVWNVPNEVFLYPTWDKTIQGVLGHLWFNTADDERCNDWGEVSELKYLFRGSPVTKRQQAHALIDQMWSYVGVRT